MTSKNKVSYIKRHFLILFLLVVILVGIMGTAIIRFSKGVVGNEIIKLHQAILKQSANGTADTLGSLKESLSNIAQNARVTQWLAQEEKTAYAEAGWTQDTGDSMDGYVDGLVQDEIYKTVTALRLAAEREEKARREFADRLADVAHQIKTPVTSIAITAQAMDQTENDPGLNRIRRQTERLERLVETLLTFARIDSGALRLEKQAVDVYTALELAAETVEPVLRRRQIELEIPNHPGISFSGDLEWTAQAFINLFKNCADHAPQGGRIAVEYEENPLYTEITVRDNGPGFAPEELPYIFRRFYQGKRSPDGRPGSGVGDGRPAEMGAAKGEEPGHGSTPASRLTQEKGVGLGLALAKSVIELQGGFIEARNLPEGGACFTVRFYCHRDVTFL